MNLSGKQRRLLRAHGHHLGVVVQIGNAGLTDGVVAAAEQALADHELIKVKIAEDREERERLADELAQRTQSERVQELGKTVLLFRQRREGSEFDLSARSAQSLRVPRPAQVSEAVTRKRSDKGEPPTDRPRKKSNSRSRAPSSPRR